MPVLFLAFVFALLLLPDSWRGAGAQTTPAHTPAKAHAPAIADAPSIANEGGTYAGDQDYAISGEDRAFLARLQVVVARHDAVRLAAMLALPLELRQGGAMLALKTAADVERHYNEIVTPRLARVILAQKPDDLSRNGRSVAVAGGAVWYAPLRCPWQKTASLYITSMGNLRPVTGETSAGADGPGQVREAAAAFLGRLQAALKARDAAWVAAHVLYPIYVTVAGHERVVKDQAGLIRHYDTIFRPARVTPVLAAAAGDLETGDDGVIFAGPGIGFAPSRCPGHGDEMMIDRFH